MIKEKKKVVDKKTELRNCILAYLKTGCISFAVATIFTILLAFHARSEMMKNLYVNKEEQFKFEQKIARQIVAHSDFTKSLSEQNYSVCLQVGNLYETAGDYQKAEYAYYLALRKSPANSYTAYYKLSLVLITLDKIDEAQKLIESVPDIKNVNLIKFKTRAYIVLGDKYYSLGKFLKASQYYEKANYYYSRLSKFDKDVMNSIHKRLVNAYVEAAGVIVKNGYNADAVRFLKKAQKYDPDNLLIKYRMALIYCDLDPIIAVELFETLQDKMPQEIDFDAYINALMKAANIEDINGNNIKAKLYRYKVHSLDVFVNNKVVHKNDVELYLNYFKINKFLFSYQLKTQIKVKNVSASSITKLNVDFVLREGDVIKERYSTVAASKAKPLLSNGENGVDIFVKFKNKVYTRKELHNYYVDIYLYKDKKYKTLISTIQVPERTIYPSK